MNRPELRAVICPEMLYPGLSLPQKVRRVAEAGFRFVEFWGWRDKPLPELAAACRETGLRVANFSGHRRGSLVAEETHPAFLEDLREAADVARRLECRTLMLLTNELGEGGRVLDSYPGIPDERKRRNVLAGLRRAVEAVPEDLLLVLEPLNTRVDHAGYYLSGMEQAAAIVREIGSPRLKVLADLYHLGMMGEDLEGLIDRHAADIGYVHVADFPGRHEPGTGEADWAGLLGRLRDRGYRGFVGFEYEPAGDSDESLRRIRAFWEAAGLGRPG